MDIREDLRRIALQEQDIRFEHFDKATAWELGNRLKLACEAREAAATIEVRLARDTVFLYAMPGTVAVNAEWARRKRNVTELLEQSSYAVGLTLERDGQTLQDPSGLPMADFAPHGGCFPIALRNGGFIGAVTVSGLPQREDHALVVEVLAQMCGVELEGLALEE